MKRVYIAGALNSDSALGYLANTSRMMDMADKVLKSGYAVFVPALDMLMCMKFGDYNYDLVFNNSQAFLVACDAVCLTPGWESSKGTQREIALAKEKGIPVFETIEDLIKSL